jgi:twitching motility protein PilT
VNLRQLIALARDEGASDLHIEPGLAPMLRVRSALRTVAEPVTPASALQWAQELIGGEDWPEFERRRSVDLSRTIEGQRCRINVLHTARGIGLAVRLLPAFLPTIENLNLHPDLKQFVQHPHGLVLICGSTGSGKSTTLAALIQTINATEARHILTIENPIEFTFRPNRSFIRQREVGRDTPSFEQALLDSLREDPDVLMVGEMRETETMRLTMNAAETGHLVLATVHSSNCAEALQRVIGAFPPEIQSNVAAQMADCLIGVISQRLLFRPNVNICVPECEVLTNSLAVKNFIRNRDFFKIISSIETGAEHGMWSYARYRLWLDRRAQFNIAAESPVVEAEDSAPPARVPAPFVSKPAPAARVPETSTSVSAKPKAAEASRIDIEPTEIFEKILKPPG